MAHVVAPNLRGKGVSTKKFTKAGEPKRSGNWSVSTIHNQSLQSKDYLVWVKTYKETGVEILMVGDHTPLSSIMGEKIATLAMNDPHFEWYRQRGKNKTIGNGKEYEAHKTLRKYEGSSFWLRYKWGVYREEIYTDGDFDYLFPEY